VARGEGTRRGSSADRERRRIEGAEQLLAIEARPDWRTLGRAQAARAHQRRKRRLSPKPGVAGSSPAGPVPQFIGEPRIETGDGDATTIRGHGATASIDSSSSRRPKGFTRYRRGRSSPEAGLVGWRLSKTRGRSPSRLRSVRASSSAGAQSGSRTIARRPPGVRTGTAAGASASWPSRVTTRRSSSRISGSGSRMRIRPTSSTDATDPDHGHAAVRLTQESIVGRVLARVGAPDRCLRFAAVVGSPPPGLQAPQGRARIETLPAFRSRYRQALLVVGAEARRPGVCGDLRSLLTAG
jgi:hypothetical protein